VLDGIRRACDTERLSVWKACVLSCNCVKIAEYFSRACLRHGNDLVAMEEAIGPRGRLRCRWLDPEHQCQLPKVWYVLKLLGSISLTSTRPHYTTLQVDLGTPL
jgi:hypothetical protein